MRRARRMVRISHMIFWKTIAMLRCISHAVFLFNMIDCKLCMNEKPNIYPMMQPSDHQKIGIFGNFKCGWEGDCGPKRPKDPCQNNTPSGDAGRKDCCLSRTSRCCNRMVDFPEGVIKTASPCKEILNTVCGGQDGYSWNHPACRTHLYSLINGGDSSADESITKYCKPGGAGAENERCACLNKDEEQLRAFGKSQGLSGDPVCWYDPCRIERDPFMTSDYSQRRDMCPITNCVVKDVYLSANDKDPIPLQVKEQCGEYMGVSEKTVASTPVFTSSAPIQSQSLPGANSSANNKNGMLLAGAGALAALYTMM